MTTTVRNSKVSSRDFAGGPDLASGRESAAKVSSLHRGLYLRLLTFRDWAAEGVGRSRAYWVPPKLMTEPPASVADLSAYARRAGWTSRGDGPVRALGIAWFVFVALPWTTACRYVEWFAQRPGRCLAAFLVWQTVIRSIPGLWAVDHVVRPILAAAAWVFLP
jgi:hypothetical protein